MGSKIPKNLPMWFMEESKNRVKTILVLLEANQMEIKGVTHFKNFDRYNVNFHIILPLGFISKRPK